MGVVRHRVGLLTDLRDTPFSDCRFKGFLALSRMLPSRAALRAGGETLQFM
jgi:hypothetical protein